MFRRIVRCCTLVATLAWASSWPAGAAEAPPRVGDKAEGFRAVTPDGNEVEFSPEGEQTTVLVFLRGFPGYQCPICTRQVSSLARSASEFEQVGARVLLVYPGPAQSLSQKAKQFDGAQHLPEGFELVIDPDYKIVNRYNLRWDAPRETAYPSTFVIDRSGIVRYAKISKTHGGRPASEEVVKAAREAAETVK